MTTASVEKMEKALYDAGFGDQLNESFSHQLAAGVDKFRLYHHEKDPLGLGHGFFQPDIAKGKVKFFYNGFKATTIYGLDSDRVIDNFTVGKVMDKLQELYNRAHLNPNDPIVLQQLPFVASQLRIMQEVHEPSFLALVGYYQPPFQEKGRLLELTNEEMEALTKFQRKFVREKWVDVRDQLTISEAATLLVDVNSPRTIVKNMKVVHSDQGRGAGEPMQQEKYMEVWYSTNLELIKAPGKKDTGTTEDTASEQQKAATDRMPMATKVHFITLPLSEFDFSSIRNFRFPALEDSSEYWKLFKTIRNGGIGELASDVNAHPKVQVTINLDKKTWHLKGKHGSFIKHALLLRPEEEIRAMAQAKHQAGMPAGPGPSGSPSSSSVDNSPRPEDEKKNGPSQQVGSALTGKEPAEKKTSQKNNVGRRQAAQPGQETKGKRQANGKEPVRATLPKPRNR